MTINRNLAKFAPSINTSGKAAVATITVTVAGGKYVIDGTSQQTISLSKGITYRFDNSDSSNSGHPLRFSTTSNGTHASGSQFTTGITTVGTAGSAGAYVEVTLEQDVADPLYTYCPNHSGMGGTVKTAYGNSNVVEDTSPQLGGNLDVNGNSIVSASNGNIAITPNGSGKVILDGLSHPTADGSAGHVLKTDGSGQLSFGTVSTPSLSSLGIANHDNLSVDGSGNVALGSSSIAFGSSKWTIVLDGNDLDFKYNGTTVFKLASNGAVTSADNITAYGSP